MHGGKGGGSVLSLLLMELWVTFLSIGASLSP